MPTKRNIELGHWKRNDCCAVAATEVDSAVMTRFSGTKRTAEGLLFTSLL